LNDMANQRLEHEIQHGQFLASVDAETAWGWGTPAGRVRAQRRGRLILDAAELAPGDEALEIGCGTGIFTQVFAQSGAGILAVDPSEELLHVARQRQFPEGNVRFEAVPFEDHLVDAHAPYDAVIGSSVLHHLEVAPAIERLFSVLKPGGHLAFAEPNMLNPQIFAERTFLRSRLSQVSPDETAFVRWRLSGQLARVGFTDIRIRPYDWLHPAAPPALIGAISAIGRVFERVPLLREFAGSLIISAQKPA
jgi:2-polyprenyl-3-methyl-5-hydroxy-6-metoxy-1,4-benzoquinol methylase